MVSLENGNFSTKTGKVLEEPRKVADLTMLLSPQLMVLTYPPARLPELVHPELSHPWAAEDTYPTQ